MNPIKTPQEMLAELSGIPHFVSGGQVSAGIMQLIQKARKMLGRELTPAEFKEIESLARPTSKGIPSNPARLEATTPHPNLLVDQQGYGYRAAQGPRGLTTPEQAGGFQTDPFAMSPVNMAARKDAYQLGTRALKTKVGGEKFAELPTKLKVLDDRDPFLTEAMTGRSPSRTYQKPFTTNIDDLAANKAQLESKGIYEGSTGTEAGGMPTQSTTPSADFFAQRSAAIENAALPDNLVEILRQKLGRQPTKDEVNSFIANLNVMGQDYTGQGAAAFANTRPFPKGRPTKEQEAGIAAYRQNAIDSGISPSATTAGGAELRRDYPNLMKEREFGPEPGMKEGGSVDELRHLMMAYGHEPQHFKNGNRVSSYIKDMTPVQKIAATIGPMDVLNEMSEGRPGGAVMSGVDTLAGSMLPFFKGYLPLQALTYSSNLGPREGSREWDIENQSRNMRDAAEFKAQNEAEKIYRKGLSTIDPMLLENYEKTNYPGLK